MSLCSCNFTSHLRRGSAGSLMDSTQRWKLCTYCGTGTNQTSTLTHSLRVNGGCEEASSSQTEHITAEEWKASVHSSHRQPASACTRVHLGKNTMRRVSPRRGLSEIRATCPSNTVECRQSAHTHHKPIPRQIKSVHHMCQYSQIHLGVAPRLSLIRWAYWLVICHLFEVVNILFSQQAETALKGVDREVNKVGIVPPFSMATISHSFPLKWALIDSNFMFWPAIFLLFIKQPHNASQRQHQMLEEYPKSLWLSLDGCVGVLVLSRFSVLCLRQSLLNSCIVQGPS